LSSFHYNWQNRYLHKDSVLWTIDGQLPDSGDVYITGGANSKDLPPVFSTGSSLSLNRNRISKYAQGVHSAEIVVHFPESTVTTTWQFKYFETKYNVICARTVVDTSYNVFDTYWTNYTKYELLSIKQADTSVFGKALGLQLSDSLIPYLLFDTNGITKEFVAKKGSMGAILSRDTFDAMIIQIQRGVEKYDEWYGPVDIDQFLKQNNPPFSVTDALHSLTRYVTEKGIEIRPRALNSELKLGPLFELGYKGDPGWLLTASHDSSSWYFTYRLGYGDCPLGCTEWTTMKFRVFKDGTVKDITTSINPRLSNVNVSTITNNSRSYYFNLQGQRSGSINPKVIANGIFVLKSCDVSRRTKEINLR
jgi:hypothetical protein